MKKKIFIGGFCFISLITAITFSSSNLTAGNAINPDCPNGCVDGNEACLCNGWHYNVKEADWGGSTVITHE